MNKLVAASSNPGKIREFREVLGPLGFDIVPQSELGIADAEEPHPTFVENALAKARHACRYSGVWAFADDSGICVAALHGEPGVRSSRYAGSGDEALDRDSQDARNNRKLVAALSGARDRRAHYYCVMVLVRRADDPEPLLAEGRWHGEVIDVARGMNGFGYDPYFFVPALARTAAELDPAEKNAVSHRGIALRQLVSKLLAEQG
jgi:XTP/dITP diphosphohydrolase